MVLIVLDEIGEKIVTGGILILIIIALVLNKSTPDALFMVAVVAVLLLSILTPAEAFSGFGSETLITIGCLFLVVGALDKSHMIDDLARHAFGMRSSDRVGTFRALYSCFFLSSVLNNTPLVALMMPIVRDWARIRGISPSQLLIPLSYAIVEGGLLTMIGTSTSLVVQGIMSEEKDYEFSFLSPGYVCLPIGIIGVAYMVFAAPYLLPNDKTGLLRVARDRANELIAEIEISDKCPLVGCDVSMALQALGIPPSTLVKIRRSVSSNKAVKTNTVKVNRADVLLDRVRSSLSFASRTEAALDLQIVPNSNLELTVYQSQNLDFAPPTPTLPIDESENRTDKSYMAQNQALWGRRRGGSRNNAFDDDKDSKMIETDDNDVSDLENPALFSQSLPETDKSLAPVPQSHFDILNPDTREILQPYDVIFVAAARDAVVHLHQHASDLAQGIKILDSNVFDLTGFGSELIEVVLSDTNPFVKYSFKSYLQSFCTQYQCSVVAVRRRDYGVEEEVNNSITSDFILSAGDVLLLIVKAAKIDELTKLSDFFVVSKVGSIAHTRSRFDYIPVLLFLLMILIVILLPKRFVMSTASFSVTGLLFLGGWLTSKDITSGCVSWPVIVMVGASLSFAKAITASGLAEDIASLVGMAGAGKLGSLFLVYLITLCLTEVIPNNAAAAIMTPIALAVSDKIDASFKPFCMAVLIASSAIHACPIGYQTHVMVWGPGGYKFTDFVKFGIGLDLMFLVAACLLIPVFWPL